MTASDPAADRERAMAAVRATFERYKLIVALRPKDHIVRQHASPLEGLLNLFRISTAKSWRAWSLSMRVSTVRSHTK
jgi:hypothetical protein